MHTVPIIPRCVVTGHKDGRSIIAKDGLIDNVSEHIPRLVISDVWATNTMPVDLHTVAPVENTLFPHTPRNGSYFRYVSIPPDRELKSQDGGAENNNSNAPHPLMHKTSTLDYIIILSGELYLILEEGETLLRAGDIVIQRGTNHAWSNRSDTPCIQLAILLDAS